MKPISRKLTNLSIFIKKLSCFAFMFLAGTYSYASSFEENWTPLYKGVDYRLVVKKNGALRIHQMKIDANDPDVELFVTPPAENGRETIATKPSTFLKRENAQVVINGTGYYPANLAPEGTKKVPETRTIYGGVQYTEPQGENALFIVLHDRTKKVIKSEEFSMYEGSISMAVGAWPWAGVQGLLIEEGKSLVPNEIAGDEIAARSALGISEDEKSIYLILVEGRPRQASIFKELVSEGVSLIDLVGIMQELGCQRAMNLDGGGSATMVIENIINNKPLILNVPSDHKGERAVGSHLGIRALHIMEDAQLKTFREIQENTAFFDLLSKSEAAVREVYMDKATLARLDSDDITTIDKLYERFGISKYSDFNIAYDLLLKSQGKENCFFKDLKYDFSCGDPQEFLDQLGIKKSDYIMRHSDLKFVGEKQTGYTVGGTFMDIDKVFYFVKKAQSVKNELLGSRLMNLILGTENTAIVKLLEDNPEMVASRMIRGFNMAKDCPKQNFNGEVDLAIAMDFIGLTDRHKGNMGCVELDSKNIAAARIDYDHSFAFEAGPEGQTKFVEQDNPLSLKLLYRTLEKYPSRDIIPIMERIIGVPDQQLFMVVFGCWTALSKIGNSFSLEDSFDLASKLIARKGAFEKALLEIKELNKRKSKERNKLAFVRDPEQVYSIGGDRFKLEETRGVDKVGLLINDVKEVEFDISDKKLKKTFEYANEVRTYVVRLGQIGIDKRNFVNIESVEVIETAKLKAEEAARKAAEAARIKEEQRIAAEAAKIEAQRREASRVRREQRAIKRLKEKKEKEDRRKVKKRRRDR